MLESIDWVYGRSCHPEDKIEYTNVPEGSNLAKILFMQEFGLFYMENEEYCKVIIDSLDKVDTRNRKAQIKNNQRKYM